MAHGNDYNPEMPTESGTLDALAELVGAQTAEDLWAMSVRDLGLTRPVGTAAELRKIAEHMMMVGDLIRVAGRSTKVRVDTYEALSATVPR